MKLIRWTRFSWDLKQLAPSYPEVDSHYRIRQATVDDEKAVRTVVYSAFTLDSNWNFLLGMLKDQLDNSISSAFKGEPLCMVVTHGARVIAASALTANRDAENHLLTGPCILMEYRNRGLATALLAQSLMALRDAGLSRAYGVTKQNCPTSEFVYTKFGSFSEPYEYQPHLAAS